MRWIYPQSLNLPEPGLPEQNYITGQYAVAEIRSIPQMWIVWTYLGVEVAQMLIMTVSLTCTTRRYHAPERSSYPVMDFNLLAHEDSITGPLDVERKGSSDVDVACGKFGRTFKNVKADGKRDLGKGSEPQGRLRYRFLKCLSILVEVRIRTIPYHLASVESAKVLGSATAKKKSS